jgi:NAD(P)-dependent dehydrogenase (short-subunit alcohol dehydrogenase family)
MWAKAMSTAKTRPLAGRAALITGANRGFGLELARAFLHGGASLMLCARDVEKLEAAGKELRAVAGSEQEVRWRAADVSDVDDVEHLARETIGVFPRLQILINNAGVYGPMGPIEEVDWADWVRAIEINLFGSILPTRALLEHFKRQRYGKIIQLSGGGATNPMPRLSAYATSKAGIVRFVETIAKECADFGIDVNAIAPGALNTQMLDEVLAAGPEKVGPQFFARAMQQKAEGGVLPERGAELAIFLASAESDGITGRLISAIWDDWAAWPGHLDELRESDLYTLRRIAGRDRGKDWGDR